jgi:protein-glutamine gamma-glutamyltransferase
MSLSISFELASRLLALSGFLSLLLTGELNLPFIAIPILALALSLSQAMTDRRFILPRRIWNSFTVLALLYSLMDLVWISGSLLMASTHFLILLMVNKLFNLQAPQDHLQLYIISFLELLAASALTINLAYAMNFLLFLFVGVWALMLYHLTVEQKAHAPHRTPPVGRPSGRQPEAGPPTDGSAHSAGRQDRASFDRVITVPFFLATNGLAMGSFVLTLMIFFLLPRMSIGLMHQKNEPLIRLSGFSERVDLGVIGAIKLDPTVVMRIEIPDGKPSESQLYWRGGSYDYYDGYAWKNSFGPGKPVPRDLEGRFLIRPASNLGKALRQEILLEPLDTAVLFAASQPVAVQGSRLFQIQANAMDVLNLNFLPATRLQYTAYSEIPTIDQRDRLLESWGYPAVIKGAYLQLPGVSAQVGRLAQEVTQRAPTIYEKVLLIEGYLQKNFRYSLDVKPPPDGMLPIEDFLLHQKTGYCEYYATAMVLMLRHLGIPARLVTGFLPGEWNDFGNYYLVRQEDAHSWVEVYFPHSGWITFDPTPSAGPEYHPAVLSVLSKYLDALRLRWDRYIIRFSFRDQIELAKNVKTQTDSLRAAASRWMALVGAALKSVKESFLKNQRLVLIASAISLGILGWLLHRKKEWLGFKLRRRNRSRAVHAVRFYAKLLAVLAAYGFHKAPNKTPIEFARQTHSLGESIYRPVIDITLAYYRLRFGNLQLSDEDKQRIEHLLLSIQQEAKKTDNKSDELRVKS